MNKPKNRTIYGTITTNLSSTQEKTSLVITGIPESCYESAKEVVIKITGDIEISHKLKRRDKTAIIVKFMNHKIKTKLLIQRKDQTEKYFFN